MSRLRGVVQHGLGLAGRVFLVALLVALVALVGSLFALRLEATRSEVERRANRAIAELFHGKVVIDRISRIDLGGVRADAHLLDTEGRRVLEVRGVEVNALFPRLLWTLLSASGPHTLTLDELSVAAAEIVLVDDGKGRPTLAQALTPRQQENAEPGSTTLRVSSIRVTHSWVHGQLDAFGPIDADVALSGRLQTGPGGTRAHLERASVRARNVVDGMPANLGLSLDLFTPPEPQPVSVQGEFAVSAPGLDLFGDGAFVGGELGARLELTRMDPGFARRFLPSVALKGGATGVLAVSGPPSALEVDAKLFAAGAEVSLDGQLVLEPELRFSAKTVVQRLNLSALVRDAPPSRIGATLEMDGERTGDGLSATYLLRTRDVTVSGTALPALSTSGRLESRADVVRVDGRADVAEPGVSAELAYRLDVPGGAAPRAFAEWRVRLDDPPRLVSIASVRAVGSAHGRASYAGDGVSAELFADLASLSGPGVRLGRTRLEAEVSGDTAAPRLDATLHGEELTLPVGTFESARVTADGTLDALDLGVSLRGKRPGRVEFSARFSASDVPTLQGVNARLSRGGNDPPVRLSVERVRFASSTVVSNARLSGAGRARASFALGRGLERLEAETEGLELGRLARLVGGPDAKGKLTAKVHYEARGGTPKARAQGKLTDFAYAKVDGFDAHFDVALERARLDATLDATLAPDSRASVQLSEVRVPRRFTSTELLRALGSRGRLAVDGSFDLARLEAFTDWSRNPVSEASGRLDASIVIEGQPGGLPTLEAQVATRKLELVGRRQEGGRIDTRGEALESEPWQFAELDLDAELEVDAERRLSLRLAGTDRRGELVEANLDTRLPERLETLTNSATLRRLPWEASLVLNERAVEQLPPLLRPESLSGRLQLALEGSGTIEAPRVALKGSLSESRPKNPGHRPSRAPALDVSVDATYETSGGQLQLMAEHRGERLARVAATWSGDAAELARAEPRSPIRGSARVEVTDVPLDAVPALEARGLSGCVSGEAQLEGLGEAARLEGRFAFTELEVQTTKVGRLDVQVALDRELEATLTSRGPGGSVHARARAAVRWGDRLVPELGDRTVLALRTSDFRLGALEPLLAGTVSELDGRLDAHLDVELSEASAPRSRGHATLSKGVLQVPAIGQRFHDVSARIDVAPRGVRLRDIKAKGVSGALRASAELALSEDLAVERVSGELRIAEAEKLPVTVEGQTVGDAWGTLRASFTPEAREDVVKVDIEELHVQMPDASPAAIQELAPNEHIRAGVWQGPSDFAALPLQPIQEEERSERPMVLHLRLGTVHIERGEEVEVELGGQLLARSAETTRFDGTLELREGTLDVFGKTFLIERGTVTFKDDAPDDAVVSAVARWDSPLGYEVYAEYVGTVSNGKIELRSDPPLPRDQVLSLVLFGTPDGSVGAGGGSSAATALGIAGGTATRGLNRVLDDFTNLDVQTRVDTSSGEARPELVVQVTPRVAARVTRALGEPTPGMAPDRTTVTLDFRLDRRWSLSARVGDQGGSALDLIWRRRY